MTDHDAQLQRAELPEPHGRQVELVKIKLLLIIDQNTGMLEWKVTGIKGDPPRISFLADGGGDAGQPDAHFKILTEHIFRLLEQYCEPF